MYQLNKKVKILNQIKNKKLFPKGVQLVLQKQPLMLCLNKQIGTLKNYSIKNTLLHNIFAGGYFYERWLNLRYAYWFNGWCFAL